MLSIKHKFIFIHIPKTGGNSIHNALRPFSEDQVVCKSGVQDGIERFEATHSPYNVSKHSTLSDYLAELPAPLFDDCRVFTCIRNPWERMISYYFSPHRQVSKWSRQSFVEMLINETKNSEYYLLDRQKKLHEKINYIRFEQLSADFKKICRSLNIKQTHLPHYNTSAHERYSRYYDSELIQMVAQKSRLEIEIFGYEF